MIEMASHRTRSWIASNVANSVWGLATTTRSILLRPDSSVKHFVAGCSYEFQLRKQLTGVTL